MPRLFTSGGTSRGIGMVLRAEFMLGHSEFNEFLYAVVGEEKSGIRLTVLSALARMGLDPWREAARLSDLPREAATSALAAMLHRLPEGDWKASDAWAIADRLVRSLPRRGSAAVGSPPEKYVDAKRPKFQVPNWLFWIAIGAAVYFALSRLDVDRTSQSDRSDAWSQTENVGPVAMVVGGGRAVRRGTGEPHQGTGCEARPRSSNKTRRQANNHACSEGAAAMKGIAIKLKRA